MLTFLSICFILVCQVMAQSIEMETKEYFESELYKKCEETWSTYRFGYEDSISKALLGFGRESMNLYIKRQRDSLLLTDGYYHSDNQVQMVFQEMLLEQLPHLVDPELELNLCANVMKIKSIISSTIIHTPYMLFRNRSDIIFSLNDENGKNSSPLRIEQVRNIGSMTITTENCFLTGQVLTTLDGSSVTVKHGSIDLKECDYDIEVYVEGQKTPPVMAKYLFDDNGLKLQDLVTAAINKELLPHMQAAMFAFVNVTSIFGDKLLELQTKQKILLSKSHAYMSNVLREVNTYLIEKDLGTVQMKDFQIYWNESFDGEDKNCAIKLTEMKVYGLESAYSTQVGAPFKPDSVKIMEQVKLSSLQVLGKVILEGLYEGEYKFAADIYDAAIDVILDVDTLQQNNQGSNNDGGGHVFKVVGWRAMDFSSPNIEHLPIESIVTGYLLTELPNYIINPLKTAFESAIKNTKINIEDDYFDEKEPVVSDAENNLSENAEDDENDEEVEDSDESEPENIDENNVAVRSKRKRHRHRSHRRQH